MDREQEHAEKVRLLRAWLDDRHWEGALFTTQANFSWITAGGESYVSLGGDEAVGFILVTPKGVFLLTNNIEEKRLLEEEISGLPIEAVCWPWPIFDGWREACARLADPSKILADRPNLAPLLYDPKLTELRYMLLPPEIERYRNLGQQAAMVVETVCREMRPGMTEREVAGRVARGCWERGILPLVNLIATDERIRGYRHPLATGKSIGGRAMVVLTGRRGGLHISLTRLISFGRIDPEVRRLHEAVTAVDAAYILGSRPGRILNKALSDGLREYEAQGYRDEWELHHQGGLTGYAGREIFATPLSSYPLRSNQCVAWNPSITGTKSEDTVLIRDAEPEVLSRTGKWPVLEIARDGRRVFRPDILER